MRFDGAVYDPALDDDRLERQLGRVFHVLSENEWVTVREIAARTGDPAPSVLAQIGHLRKERFGAYEVEKRRRFGDASSLWEYRLGSSGGTPRRHTCYGMTRLLDALRELDPTHRLLPENER